MTRLRPVISYDLGTQQRAHIRNLERARTVPAPGIRFWLFVLRKALVVEQKKTGLGTEVIEHVSSFLPR